jgi:hypothetical protein
MDEPVVVAVGTLAGSASAWVGFVRGADGYRLVCADVGGTLHPSASEGDARSDELLLVAIAHFEEALDPPPLAWEATQADLAALLGWLVSTETDAGRLAALAKAVDAIDDGLAGDAVAGRLAEARAGRTEELSRANDTGEPADVAAQLARRCAGT